MPRGVGVRLPLPALSFLRLFKIIPLYYYLIQYTQFQEMNIDKQSVDNLNATITISITKEDYQDKFKSELKKVAGKATMKGFRKGKTPDSVVKKCMENLS